MLNLISSANKALFQYDSGFFLSLTSLRFTQTNNFQLAKRLFNPADHCTYRTDLNKIEGESASLNYVATFTAKTWNF